MNWFRSNIRHGARLALFALLVQLALTFGHSHGLVRAAPLVQSSQHQASQQQADSHTPDTAIGQVSADHVSANKQSPASPDREHTGHDNCAICAVIAMASNMLLATPPLLQLPEAVELLYRATDAEFLHLKSAGTAFQPRAPPTS